MLLVAFDDVVRLVGRCDSVIVGFKAVAVATEFAPPLPGDQSGDALDPTTKAINVLQCGEPAVAPKKRLLRQILDRAEVARNGDDYGPHNASMPVVQAAECLPIAIEGKADIVAVGWFELRHIVLLVATPAALSTKFS